MYALSMAWFSILAMNHGPLCEVIRTAPFRSCTRRIYCHSPWRLRTSLCLGNSSDCDSLECDSCASGREFAFSFLQIPPHDGHPCSWLVVDMSPIPVRDFHPIGTAHAGRTKRAGANGACTYHRILIPYFPLGVRNTATYFGAFCRTPSASRMRAARQSAWNRVSNIFM